MFAFISQVITSTDGLCVAIIRCIQTALAICAILAIDDSTSFLFQLIMRSASSSITITIYGSFSDFETLALNSFRFLAFAFVARSYLLSISATHHLRELRALSGFDITGVSRCGIQLYIESSTFFGSIIISLSSLGENL